MVRSPRARTARRVSQEEGSAEIRDPVHGYIFTSNVERELIDTATLQRLRRIRQLAGCHLVYPGGQHSRFEHVIGAMYLAGKVGEVLETRQLGLNPQDTRLLRVAALLHDVGHGPFSHMFEEVMAATTEFTHEDMTRKIILKTEIGDILGQHGISKNEIADLSVGRSNRKERAYLNDVIGGELSVDIMDYLLRDSYFTGVEYGKVDVKRLINSFDVVKNRLAIGQAAIFAFEALMIARYEMFRAVYFHRTVRAAELMLVKSMILADKELNLTDLSLENYLSLTDEVTLSKIRNLRTGADRDLRKAKQLADDYYSRRLLKCVFERTVQRRDRFLSSMFTQQRFRDEIAEEIASNAGANPGDVYVDVPTAPSVPISSTRETLRKIMVVRGRDSSSKTLAIRRRRKDWLELDIEQLPLTSTISGFMDVVRVYTIEKEKDKVQRAVGRVIGREGFETKISM